jgi:hypothetical protein
MEELGAPPPIPQTGFQTSTKAVLDSAYIGKTKKDCLVM